MVVDDADQLAAREPVQFRIVGQHAEDAEPDLAERPHVRDMNVRRALRVATGDQVNGHLLNLVVPKAGSGGVADVLRVKARRRDKDDAAYAKPGRRGGQVDDLDLALLLLRDVEGLVQQSHAPAQIISRMSTLPKPKA